MFVRIAWLSSLPPDRGEVVVTLWHTPELRLPFLEVDQFESRERAEEVARRIGRGGIYLTTGQ
jgi:hypothetical protein